MAMYLDFYVEDELTGEQKKNHIVLHVHEKIPESVVGNCFELQADGDELGHILFNVEGIRTTKNQVVRWYGDEANFIASNINW